MDKAPLFLLGICAILFYFIQSDVSALEKRASGFESNLQVIAIEQKALGSRLDVREIDRLYELKLAKNQEMLGDISCGECHISSDTALPIRKISMSEAISIVRFGSEKSKAGGMPLYKSFNNGKDAFITDSGLKNRLEKLYTDELLKTAVK